MTLLRKTKLLSAFFTLTIGSGFAHSQQRDTFLGIKLPPEVRSIVKEIEDKTHQPIHAEFAEQPEFQFGASYIDDDSGVAIISVDPAMRSDEQKLEAIITHELLHLRLRVNNYPTFIFSPNIRTAKGRAIDVEQEHVNDLRSIIEHRIFKSDMERFGVYKYIDLAGDTAAGARDRKGDQDGEADAINYARAILEYPDPRDTALVKQLFQANGWTRSIKDGSEIANAISTSTLTTPKDLETVFLRCLLILYRPPGASFTFTFSVDPTNKYFRRLVINSAKTVRKRT